MKISRGFALASLMCLAASPVFAQFSLFDAANALSGTQDDDAAAAAPTAQTADLLSALSQLDVTTEQAIGGAGAMLGLAKNQLSSTDYSELAKSVPGIDLLSGGGELGVLSGLLGSSGKAAGLDNLLGNVSNTNDLEQCLQRIGHGHWHDRPVCPRAPSIFRSARRRRFTADKPGRDLGRRHRYLIQRRSARNASMRRSFSIQSWLTQLWMVWRNGGSFS